MNSPPPIRVMSFNLRNSRAQDGENAWPYRRDMVIEAIRAANIDLLGVQEALSDQVDFLRERLPDYEQIAVGRDDGACRGEACALIIKREQFETIESGTFWLSEQPQVIASRGWDAQLPRICTWSRLRLRDSKIEIVFASTHFDHKGAIARVESAKQIVRWISDAHPSAPAILAGDFNATDQTPEYAALTTQFRDAWRAIHRPATKEGGTYHAFTGTRTRERIDWILCTSDFEVTDCRIDYANRAGQWPSDHFPLIAGLRLPASL